MPTPDLISIVIATYNRSDALCAVLQSLAAQDDKAFEVIVADDGSRQSEQDLIAQCAERLGLQVCHIWHPDVGFTLARVRNLGVAVACGSYVILLDGDCVVETDFVRRHRELAQPGYVVNGSRVLLSQALTQAVIAGQTTIFGRSYWFWLALRLRGQASKLTGLLRLPDMTSRVQHNFVWKRIRGCNIGVWRT